ncbi:hypothetical protein chiPu_0029129 [Chiloscyllium punctatum]|uniref:Uncharacterized protein n=1 Tax=Chiloscyllium punctatum TaxID=137246 RepID=A0A401TPV7_CHIPU|nr:hypothetical protein [Chiloscyllium punctatum]
MSPRPVAIRMQKTSDEDFLGDRGVWRSVRRPRGGVEEEGEREGGSHRDAHHRSPSAGTGASAKTEAGWGGGR